MSGKLLEAGQHVWIEKTGVYFRGVAERSISECKIVEANKSSAYAVSIEDIAAYEEAHKTFAHFRRRIDQRTHDIKGRGWGDSYRLWLTKEDFEHNVQYVKEMSEARKKGHALVDTLTLSELNKLIGNFE